MANNTFLALKVEALYPPGPFFPRPCNVLDSNSTRSGASDPFIFKSSLLSGTDIPVLGTWPKFPSDPNMYAKVIRCCLLFVD